ncbi:hypothetical protein D3C75_1383260 [compost metagenome]
MEEHGNTLGQPFSTGHASGLRNQQIRYLHELIDLFGKAEEMDVGVKESGVLIHLLK